MRTPFRDQPIARKALILGLVPTVSVIVVVIASSMMSTFLQARTNMVRDLEAESLLVANNVAAALAFSDKKAADATLSAYRAKTNIEAVCVFNAEGHLFSSFERAAGGCSLPVKNSGSAMIQEHDVMMGNRSVGMVRVTGSFSRLYAWMRRQALVGLATFVVGVLLAFLLTRALARTITEPLEVLAATADTVSTSRDYGIRAKKMTADEVGSLVSSFNSMLDQIQEQHNVSARALDREREAGRLKDHFLAAVSHELRTPLNAIMGWLQIVQTTNPSKEVIKRAMDSVERNARAQARVVEDLIDISRVVTGKLQLRTAPVDMRLVTKAALEVIHAAVQAKSLTLVHNLPAEPATVLGDADRLQQIMWNLLSNAVKFTPPGGTVTLTLAALDRSVVATVEDTGIGIAPAFLPYVFDRFRQADGSMTREYGGLGLGLAIAKELTDLHGGSLSAASGGNDSGAKFVLQLPRISAAQQLDARSSHPLSADKVLNGVRVLAVDDDRDALEVISEVLRAAGADIVTALSGTAALDEWRRGSFDVLLCDLAMPGMDGFSVVREIGRININGTRPFAIALSAHTLAEDKERSRAAGFHLHLGKPFEIPALLEAIRTRPSN